MLSSLPAYYRRIVLLILNTSARCLSRVTFSYFLLTPSMSFSTYTNIPKARLCRGKGSAVSLRLLTGNRVLIYLKGPGEQEHKRMENYFIAGFSGQGSMKGPRVKHTGLPEAEDTGNQIIHRTEMKAGARLQAQNRFPLEQR